MRGAGLVVDGMLAGNDSNPTTFHELAHAFPDADRVGGAIRDVGHTNAAVAVEHPVEGLPLIGSVVGVGAVAAAETTDVAAHCRVGDEGRSVYSLGRIAAGGHLDEPRHGVRGADVEIDSGP